MAYGKAKAASKIGRWYRKRRFRRGASAGVKALRMVRTMRRAMEHKKFDRNATAVVPILTSPTMWDICRVVQGDTAQERDGLKICIKSLYVKMSFVHPDRGTVDDAGLNPWDYVPCSTQCTSRVIIFIDRQQVSDVNPNVNDLLEANELLSPLEHQVPGRFQVLLDRLITTSVGANMFKTIKLYKKLNLHTWYNGTTGTDIQKNGIYVYIAGNGSGNANENSHVYIFRGPRVRAQPPAGACRR